MTTAVGVCLLWIGSISAQETKATITAASSDRLQTDLKSLIDLSAPNLQKQWTTLKDVLDSFVQGVSTNAPARLDVHFGTQELTYVATVPVADLDGRNGFIANIKAFGNSVQGPDATGLYTISPQRAVARGPRPVRNPAPAAPTKPYYMRVFNGHAVLSGRADLLPKTAAEVGQAITDVKGMLPGATDVSGELKNTAASMAAGQRNFKELRKQLEAAVEFRRGEAQADFELRKLSLEQNLDEAQRFLTESQLLQMRWTTDEKNAKAHGELLLTGVPGSSLAESIDLLVQQPSQFANVKFGPKPALQLRLNMAMDPMRSAHAEDLYRVMLPSLQGTMDSRPNLNAEGKATAKSALAQLFQMLNDSLPLKILDAIVDVHSSSDGKYVGVCAIRTADGTKATDILALFPKIRSGWKFETNVAQQQGVVIHKLTVPMHRKEEFQAVFGGELAVLIGVSKNAVWGAAGQGALDRLKTAIDEAALPAPTTASPEFLSLDMRVEPWIRVLDAMRSKEPPSTSTDKAQIEFEKQRDKTRKYALETLGSRDDIIQATLSRKGNEVHGTFDVHPGILRFIGTMLADFTAENLR